MSRMRKRRRVFVDLGGVVVDFDAYKITLNLTGEPIDTEPVAAPSAVHTALRMLIAAGFVTQAKASEALRIATGFMPGPLEAPPAPCNPTTPETCT